MAGHSGRRARERDAQAIKQLPYCQFRHGFAPIEVPRPGQVEAVHDAAMTILETTGPRVLDAEARAIPRHGGFAVDEVAQRVRFDRGREELCKASPRFPGCGQICIEASQSASRLGQPERAG